MIPLLYARSLFLQVLKKICSWLKKKICKVHIFLGNASVESIVTDINVGCGDALHHSTHGSLIYQTVRCRRYASSPSPSD